MQAVINARVTLAMNGVVRNIEEPPRGEMMEVYAQG